MLADWDTTVALAYAAEELVFAAQALTTDLVTRDRSVSIAHRHLREVLEHEHDLPAEIGFRLRKLDGVYAQWETGANPRDDIAIATTAVLERVRDLLRVSK